MKKLFLLLILIVLCSCGSGNSADIEYVALGASDAVGIGATPLTNGYVYRIEDGIEDGGKEVELENLGIPGAEIDNIDNLELPFADFDNPELITLFTGANDLIDGDDPAVFETELESLLRKLREDTEPDTIIAIANLPDLTKAPRFIDDPDADVTMERIVLFNQAISRQAIAANAVLVNLFSIDLNDSVVRDEDGFHPNDKGHEIIANAFLAVLLPLIYPAQ